MNSLEQLLFLKGYESLYQPLWNYSVVDALTDYKKIEDAGKWTDGGIVQQQKGLAKAFGNRMDLILPEIDNPTGTFIDIGCNIGFNSFEVYKNGGTVTGLDNEEAHLNVIAIANHLIEHHKLDTNRINFVNTVGPDKPTTRQFIALQDINYDYCICFLVLHHYFSPYIKLRSSILDHYGKEFVKIAEQPIESDTFFTPFGRRLIQVMQEKCNTSFIQVRFETDDELMGSSNTLFVDYLIDEIGFKEVKVLYSGGDRTVNRYYAKPSPIYKCVN